MTAVRTAAVAVTVAALGLTACSGSGASAPSSPKPGRSAASTSASMTTTPTAAATPTVAPTTRPTPPADPALAALYAQRPAWTGCKDGFECARIRVPIDYAHAAGASIELALIRLPAGDKGRRIGSLLINPGGPGVSGIDYARGARIVVSRGVRKRYDIVGFDPRGVGTSTPLICESDAQLDRIIASDASPDDAAEEATAVELAKQVGSSCSANSAPLLGHVSTVEAARDLDLLRGVLGDDKLSYLGKSYGTFIGATYADLFPTHIARMVLDGALDPSSSSADVNREQTRGFELALRAFVDDCLGRDNCPLAGPADAALQAVSDLLTQTDRQPLPAEGGRVATQSLTVLGIAAALYNRGSWPVLRQALGQARQGDGRLLLRIADSYTDRGPDGHYANNSNDSIYAVNCLDRPDRPGIAAIRAEAAQLALLSPRFGPFIAWGGLACTYWPVPATGRPHRITAAGAPPILVVGTERDPATPLVWAKSLADQLASGVLLVWNGDGHTAYRRGSSCIDGAVDSYLLDGKAPADGKRC